MKVVPRTLIFVPKTVPEPLPKPGAVDPSFPIIGLAPGTICASEGVQINAVEAQRNGRLVIAGALTSGSINSSIVVKRYTTDGKPDSTFGNNGTVVQHIGTSSLAFGLTLQRDSKIVAVGNTNGQNITSWVVLRYNPDGSPDSGFGSNGQVTLSISNVVDQAFSVLQQPDGKLVVGGETWSNDGSIQFALARFLSDGSLDSSFGNQGVVTLQVGAGPYSGIRKILLTPSGKIIAAGYGDLGGNNSSMGVARFNADGALDGNFGNDGTVSLGIDGTSSYANDAALAPDGLVLAGVSQQRGAGVQNIAMMKLTAQGALDQAFGDAGIKVTPLAGFSFNDGNGIARQEDGGLLLAAKLGNGPNDGSFSVLQFSATGELNPSFGSHGVTITNFHHFSAATCLALQADGKVVLGGYSSPEIENFLEAMARYFG